MIASSKAGPLRSAIMNVISNLFLWSGAAAQRSESIRGGSSGTFTVIQSGDRDQYWRLPWQEKWRSMLASWFREAESLEKSMGKLSLLRFCLG